MKISLNWIKQFVSVPKKFTAKALSELLTLRTCEVEGLQDQTKGLEGVVVGEILAFEKHPQAEKLHIAKVDIGREKPLQLIFGQMVKLKVGNRIPVAIAPTVLPTGIEILAKDIRGVRSEGMLCLEQELGFKAEGVSILYFPNTLPGTPLAEALGLDDIIFEIDNKSLTHRPDLWGHYGMAREFSAFLRQPLKPYEIATKSGRVVFPKKGLQVTVDIQSEKISPRFCAAIITGVKIAESPEWIKKQLMACGVRPVNNVVDITNFVMLELGQPMHAFDRKEVGTDHLEVRYAKEGEMLETLDHKKRTLTKGDAIISNGKILLGLAGIMGGLHSEISGATTEIIFEAANWNPVMIRKTSQRFGLRSEASQRFEKSLDPDLCDKAIKRACALLLELCETTILAGALTAAATGNSSVKKLKVTLSPERVSSKIGVPIAAKDIIQYLSALGFTVQKSGKFLTVLVPSYRAAKDVSIEDDLIEEVARMYGYEKIPATLPDLPIRLPHENRERKLKHHARDILSLALGYTEVSSYSFYNSNDFKKCLMEEEGHFRVANPLSEDQTHMRKSLIPNLLKCLAANERTSGKIKIYEIGRRYAREPGSYFPREEKFLCGTVLITKPSDEIFYEAKGLAENFLHLFGVENLNFEPPHTPPPYAHPRKCADVVASNSSQKVRLGSVYELHPVVKQHFDLRGDTAFFEINFSLLTSLPLRAKTYEPLPKFPTIDIDISILVDQKTESRSIERLIRQTDQHLIQKIFFLDRFVGEALGSDKKSLTYRIRLAANDRTLTDEEMHTVQQKIFERLEGAGYQIRK